MAPEVIEALYQALKQSPPQAAAGFIALYALDPRQGLDILTDGPPPAPLGDG
ncbi:MAG: hypothetical protein ACKO21_11175 [Nodosilinea sp.]